MLEQNTKELASYFLISPTLRHKIYTEAKCLLDLNFSSGSSQIWMLHMAGWLVMVATCCAKLAGSGEESVRTEHQHLVCLLTVLGAGVGARVAAVPLLQRHHVHRPAAQLAQA